MAGMKQSLAARKDSSATTLETAAVVRQVVADELLDEAYRQVPDCVLDDGSAWALAMLHARRHARVGAVGLLLDIGVVWYDRARPDRAERCYLAALELWKTTPGDRRERAALHRLLAEAQLAQGRWVAAVNEARRALEHRAGDGDGALEAAQDRVMLASALMAGDVEHDEVEALLRDAMAAFELGPGPTSHAVALTARKLAEFLAGRGRIAEAISLAKLVLEVEKARLGATHFVVVNLMHDLALLYDTDGHQEMAVELWQEAERAVASAAVNVRTPR